MSAKNKKALEMIQGFFICSRCLFTHSSEEKKQEPIGSFELGRCMASCGSSLGSPSRNPQRNHLEF